MVDKVVINSAGKAPLTSDQLRDRGNKQMIAGAATWVAGDVLEVPVTAKIIDNYNTNADAIHSGATPHLNLGTGTELEAAAAGALALTGLVTAGFGVANRVRAGRLEDAERASNVAARDQLRAEKTMQAVAGRGDATDRQYQQLIESERAVPSNNGKGSRS